MDGVDGDGRGGLYGVKGRGGWRGMRVGFSDFVGGAEGDVE